MDYVLQETQGELPHEGTTKEKRKTRKNIKQRRLTQSLRIPLANLPSSTEELSQEGLEDDRNDDLYENLLAANQKELRERGSKESFEQNVKDEDEFFNEAASNSSTDIHVRLQNREYAHEEQSGSKSEKLSLREVASYEERRVRSNLNRLDTNNETTYAGLNSTTLQASYHECTLNAAFSRSTSPLRADVNAAQSIKNDDVGHQSINGKEIQRRKNMVSIKQTSTWSTSFEERTSLLAMNKRNEMEETSFMTEAARKTTLQYSESRNTPLHLRKTEQEDIAYKIMEEKNTLNDSLNDQCKKLRLTKSEKHEKISFMKSITDKESSSFSEVNKNTQLLSRDESSSAAKQVARKSSAKASLNFPLEMCSTESKKKMDEVPNVTIDSFEAQIDTNNQNSQFEQKDKIPSEYPSSSTRTGELEEHRIQGMY
ncbi:hypothetical protein ANCDUO_22381 [Ancylostoma duodenale]|uniref:Uncharacterized protein n=1 Tax=Ancylostoma duodenale TaxID=51022 RepID=A0A0C2FRK8_9BILA|nr:hypothetical protein ANCDUO_22381 [Ancylostoma duodenale]